MGLFNKIKNILFEDEETEDIPVYTKDDKIKENEHSTKREASMEMVQSAPLVKEAPVKHEPIKIDSNKHFNNVKRDIDSFEDDIVETVTVKPVQSLYDLPKPKVPEKKESPFLSFDEDEFERLNAHVLRGDDIPRENRGENNGRKSFLHSNGNVRPSKEKNTFESNGKRPFRPSPVISPVYGVLDKNYTKDDIVDKMDGIKREVIKPVVRKEIQSELLKQIQEEAIEVNIDNVRKKAFGELEELEKRAIDVYEDDFSDIQLEQTEDVDKSYTDNEIEEVSLEEDSILENLKKDILDDEETVESILDKEPLLDDTEEVYEKKENKGKKMHMLDDVEKTSTLQILDDIEKELNAIKPITKEYTEEEKESEKEKLENNETLENDLFDLIDSMYEEGEEEDDD